jgi:Mrp family chromosome partitioning ATPase
MSDVLSQLTERYDLVVIDTAPIGVVSDAFPLLRKVDGVIVVMRLGQSTRDSAEQLREQLGRLDAPTLGLVANGVRMRKRGKYGYGYYGGYYGRSPEQKPENKPADSSEALSR